MYESSIKVVLNILFLLLLEWLMCTIYMVYYSTAVHSRNLRVCSWITSPSKRHIPYVWIRHKWCSYYIFFLQPQKRYITNMVDWMYYIISNLHVRKLFNHSLFSNPFIMEQHLFRCTRIHKLYIIRYFFASISNKPLGRQNNLMWLCQA